MSNLLFNNFERLKTLGRFLAYDKLLSINQYNGKMERVIFYKNKSYKVEIKIKEVKK